MNDFLAARGGRVAAAAVSFILLSFTAFSKTKRLLSRFMKLNIRASQKKPF